MATFADLELSVIRWGEARRIIPNSTPQAQLMKAFSEMGELADATMKNDHDGIVDGIGDVTVCLLMYCALKDINFTDCLEQAYSEIKHRRGMMLPSGVFQKET